MKKQVSIIFTILTLVSFGSVSSARAFVDPVSLTLILGAAFTTVVTGAEVSKQTREKQAQANVLPGQNAEKSQDLEEKTGSSKG